MVDWALKINNVPTHALLIIVCFHRYRERSIRWVELPVIDRRACSTT